MVNAAGDNVFNFTTITVNTNVTIRLRASKVRNQSVVWLATGNVTINGTLNLSGDSGYTLNANDPSTLVQNHRPAEPGAGGYYGGLGSRGGVGPESGPGPGGGAGGQNVSTNACIGGGAAAYTAAETTDAFISGTIPGGGSTYGTIYLVPLYGGSGGGGGWGTNVNDVGGGGGAGGGAIGHRQHDSDFPRSDHGGWRQWRLGFKRQHVLCRRTGRWRSHSPHCANRDRRRDVKYFQWILSEIQGAAAVAPPRQTESFASIPPTSPTPGVFPASANGCRLHRQHLQQLLRRAAL